MKKFLKKVGDILWVIFLISMAVIYFFIFYAILDEFNIGVDGS